MPARFLTSFPSQHREQPFVEEVKPSALLHLAWAIEQIINGRLRSEGQQRILPNDERLDLRFEFRPGFSELSAAEA